MQKYNVEETSKDLYLKLTYEVPNGFETIDGVRKTTTEPIEFVMKKLGMDEILELEDEAKTRVELWKKVLEKSIVTPKEYIDIKKWENREVYLKLVITSVLGFSLNPFSNEFLNNIYTLEELTGECPRHINIQ